MTTNTYLLILLSLFGCGRVEGTLTIISDVTNETVFSAEEGGVDSTSAYGLMGRLVVSNPPDACSSVDPPPPPPDTSGPGPYSFILVATVEKQVVEDNCSLAKKAKVAQASGYAGIILRRLGSNSTSGIAPEFIGIEWLGVRIYACVVGDDVGGLIINRYSYPKRFYVRFDNEPYIPMGLLTNFVIIGLLAILTIILLLRLFHYLYVSVTTRVVERRRVKKTLLSQSQLKKLPVLKWSQSIPQDTCSICIDQFDNEAEIRVLPCSHVFHKDCIDKWLLKESRKCPNCKGRVLFPNERGRYTYSSDSEDDLHDQEDQDIAPNERTPLIRPRENYRFVETLTESHNSRQLNDQYLQDEEEEEEDNEGERKLPRVKFAPAVSVMSSASSSASSTTTTIGRPAISKAFVFPHTQSQSKKVGRSSLKSPLKRGRNNVNVPGTSTSKPSSFSQTQTTVAVHGVPSSKDKDKERSLSPCSFSSSSTDDTMIDYDDVKSAPVNTSSSLSTSSQSFHSCQEFESDFPSLENGGKYGSFMSISSNRST